MSRETTQATLSGNVTIGLDLGDRRSHVYAVDADGRCLTEATIATTSGGLGQYFAARPGCRVVLEVGTHSPWVARALRAWGHHVVVANPSATYGSRRRRTRNDRRDAEFLARQGRADERLLHPMEHRSAEAQTHLAMIRARDQLVQTRTKVINHVRGAVKSMGSRLSRCSAEAFPRRAAVELPDPLRPALAPLVEMLTLLTRQITAYDRQLATLVRTRYPVAQRLQQPAGVGPLTALAYVLLVEDPTRFRRSRLAGAYFGLVPRLDASSDSRPQLRISKAGDELGRRLLVSAAHYILGPFGPPCDLRRHGEAIARRGGKNAKKRAVVAVARKLAVLLHRLWVSGGAYDPDFIQQRQARAA
ncbi:MAG TPA: IS110 family transposase [Gemmatimonadota bacterium]|nr:IS110 family transposase [Gemmatimonadota bacterium]